MKNPNEDLFEDIKKEADQTLFKDLDFNDALKEKVRKEIRKSQHQKVRKKFSIFHVASIAAILLITIISASMLLNKDNTPEKADTFVGVQEDSNMIRESLLTNWQVPSVEEIKTLYSEDVLVPTYTSTGFKLESIHASGTSQEEVNQVVINYQNKEQYYSVIIDKNLLGMELQGFQNVDINGAKGYVKTEENNEILFTEVIWDKDGFHYVVYGPLSREEAIKIAKSFQ